ncbi:uncharacterized protein BX664DRAFT_332363 [Halteromyces radiatus]|uniref:uncharacterized protein n=1 Tax=Halteromyces radiatus TaxID=101107 RepID=UPI00221EFAE4|nr:uncharacterized protein BX664DRAFT_332363 [Halteromyces radiatus]KAI8089178.1 hypothetical protein BX664DRAFT_332363 [Halteromyces radiatus]
MKQLDAIEQKLMQLGSPATKARILRIPLQYQQNDHHGLFLDGNTADNRAFLMYEDEIIQCMLQLDQVLSEGDTTIRDRRRQLVKQAEQLLAPLDQHKQEEWKKETKRLQQGSKRKHRHRQKRKLHVPTTA